MARTRKRDDDSHYNNSINSDTTSLAALDVSSIDATGSRSSLTFSSSAKRKPRKRQRKSLTDALQSISLDKDKGVPQQIMKMGNFSFSKASMVFSMASGNNTAVLSGAFGGHESSSIGFNNINAVLNSQQQLDRRHDRDITTSENGDLFYDDDNSQLTSSTVDGVGGMVDDYADEYEEEEDEEDSQRKRLANMTEMEKAQRNVMLEIVFGKDHRESRKAAAAASLDREVSACEARTPPVRIDVAASNRSSSPPFASISTRTRSKATAGRQKNSAATAATTSTSAAATYCAKRCGNKERDYKNPADRKIEELLRQSLKNLREGSHPLQLKQRSPEDGDASKWTPWKTQDDMMVDPEIYSPRMGTAAAANGNKNANQSQTNLNNATSMSIEGKNTRLTKTPVADSSVRIGGTLQTPAIHSMRRPRSNSFSGGFDISIESTAMDMDG